MQNNYIRRKTKPNETMTFEFATANRIIFGRGSVQQIGDVVRSHGKRALFVTGSSPDRVAHVRQLIEAAGVEVTVFAVADEPTIAVIDRGLDVLRGAGCDVIVGCGGGSALDCAKALAALATNEGTALDYLEVIGKGQPLVNAPLPCVAVPTTAGTGSEVTRNAVLASPEHARKVSLRSPLMLPDVALVDPELTDSAPRSVTAASGMDALIQVIEPYVSKQANAITDAFCRQAIPMGSRALRRVLEHPDDTEARDDMALTSLMGGLALANAKLGAVHGFAGVLGGKYNAPHGAVCAALLAPVMETNITALNQRAPHHFAASRYDEIARWLTDHPAAAAEDGVAWVRETVALAEIPSLGQMGVNKADIDDIVQQSRSSSSMKGNPIELTDDELAAILRAAL